MAHNESLDRYTRLGIEEKDCEAEVTEKLHACDTAQRELSEARARSQTVKDRINVSLLMPSTWPNSADSDSVEDTP